MIISWKCLTTNAFKISLTHYTMLIDMQNSLVTNNMCHMYCNRFINATVRGFREHSDKSLCRSFLRGCVTGSPVGISWENKQRLITDQTHIPSRAVLRGKADHQFSHELKAVSLNLRPAEAEAHTTPLLWYTSHVATRLHAVVWMPLREMKQKHTSHWLHSGLVLRRVCFQ